jgi:hypothetical protein
MLRVDLHLELALVRLADLAFHRLV